MSKKSARKKRHARLRLATLPEAGPSPLPSAKPPEDPPPLNEAVRERIAALLPPPKVMPYPTMPKHGPKGSLPNLVLDNPS